MDPERGQDTDNRDEPKPAGVSLAGVRVLAAVAIGVLLALMAVDLMPGGAAPTEAPHTVPVEQAALQVRVKLRRNAHLRVLIDGDVTADRLYAGGDTLELPARERVEVDVPDIDAVQVWLDGTRIRPLGRMGSPRRLTFLADPNGQR